MIFFRIDKIAIVAVILLLLQACKPKPDKLNENGIEIALSKGLTLLNKAQWDSALLKFNSLNLEKYSVEERAVIYNAKGYIYDELENYPEAIENYLNAIALFTNKKMSAVTYKHKLM